MAKVQELQKLAAIYQKEGRLEEILPFFQKAIDTEPDNYKLYVGFAKILKQSNKNDEFVKASYKVLELTSNPPFWIYKDLVETLEKQDKQAEAISICKDALKSKPDQVDIYRLLAKITEKQGDIDEAITNYRKAAKLNQKLPPIFYLNFGKALQQNQQIDEAISCYQKALKEKPDFMPAHIRLVNTYQRKGRFKSQFYLVNHKYKIVYCFIPKNACTLFTTMMVEKSDEREKYEQSGQGVHRYLNSNETELRLTDFSNLKNPEYFKFVILRNPFERLVSAYLDKFAKTTKLEGFASRVVQEVHEYLGMEVNLEKSITFRQFIDYLVRNEDQKLNMHWRPQHTFLSQGLFDFDFIGQFEKLDEVTQYLEEKFRFEIKKRVSTHAKRGHVTQYGVVDSDENLCDEYPRDLRTLGCFPKAKQLYTPELEKLVRSKYAQDLEIYEREFSTSLKL